MTNTHDDGDEGTADRTASYSLTITRDHSEIGSPKQLAAQMIAVMDATKADLLAAYLGKDDWSPNNSWWIGTIKHNDELITYRWDANL